MRRPDLVYVLIAVVLAAAAGLAYYGYSYSRELSAQEQAVIIDTMRELAEEKVIGIESEIIKADNAVLRRADINNLLELQKILESERPAVESALVLDADLQIPPSGFFTKRTRKDEIARFRDLFESTVIPDLDLRAAEPGERGHLHATYQGRPYLFSYVRKASRGKTFYVVLEADLTYLVSTVFPQYFTVGTKSKRLYQVVNEADEVIYGYEFTGISRAAIVEHRFSETVSQWRLRVAQKDPGALGGDNQRQLVDVVLIATALVIIFAGVAVLVTAMRRERRANELKSEFISNVSHELKTPLSIISMFGELLAMGRTRSADQATEYAEIIWRESVRLARLIDNVLDFAKMERGADAYEFALGDVGEVADRALELSSRRLHQAGMEVDTDIEPDLPELSIDGNALTLAVLNLIDNAVKYAAAGERIALSVRRHPRGVALEVQDFGPGIAPEEQEHIFERFYRARDVRLKPIRGSGIGLALVKHIAQAHGGDVEVDSERDRGATFRLWIPTGERG